MRCENIFDGTLFDDNIYDVTSDNVFDSVVFDDNIFDCECVEESFEEPIEIGSFINEYYLEEAFIHRDDDEILLMIAEFLMHKEEVLV